ncbi:copper amine oxidase N-terminal domain-containing protein [Tissierella sp. Yu-01]|uniref:copper amine oxidase N-terminal domain-containing protein n=1 Tax=Tissierella sp. Yu-01 TaxID=3035694 RepID=UPI00240DF664|nr:copper amine oxidase N-terminal domain-containing protein [Tissierella sp. Yu-01]WFA08222.1 copper amine oxidase N-terminal domain-containing protein [Tissierella sp. Yu-01]
MKKQSKFMILLMILIMFITTPTMAESSSVKICVNGKFLYMDVDPVFDSGVVSVPIRYISEELGFQVEYLDETKTINILKDDINIAITIALNKAEVDGKEVVLDVKTFIKDGRTFVPLRFISEGLGEEVIWDQKNQIAMVGKYKDEAITDNTFIYTNDEYGYTLNMPNSWKGEAIIETKDGNLYVYDKKSAEKFIEDGFNSFGPVFEVRYSEYPVIATIPYDTNFILYYESGNYLEAIFDLDFQYYPETKDSYTKIWNEGQRVLASFKKLDDNILIDKESYKTEIGILNNILDNYVPENVFNRNEIYTLRKPNPDYNLFYLRNVKDEDEVLIKLEALFNNDQKLIQYHLKNYSYDLETNKLTQDEALKLANDFIKRYVDENINLIKTPDLYPSLYEEDKHETYGDSQWKYVVVIDLEHGFVEFYNQLGN